MKARLLLLLSLAACDRSSAQPPPQDQTTEAPTLEVVPIVAQKLDTTARLPGELTPYESVAIYPRVTGFLEEIRVDRGSKVKSGQLLARLSAPELAAQRAEAESKLSGAKSTYDRLKAASSTPGAVAQHDIEVAEAGLKADESRVASLRTLEGYLWVRAPFDGIITERNVHPGALVGPPSGPNATPMLRVEQIGHLRLTVAVPESDAGAIAEGAEAAFTVRTWPGQKFKGIVRRLSHSIDTKTRTMAVELDVDNEAGKLAPGMYAEVLWPVRRESPSLFVPASAVVQTTERTFVDRVRWGVVEQVTVQRGQTLPDRVEVYGNLAAGDLVLRRGSEELKTGAHVTTKMASRDGG
jgi:RND family efflux transporter MFP subunit